MLKINNCRINIYSAFLFIGLVIAIRLMGGLQFFELMALDFLQRIAPGEDADERIVIIGITEEDLKKLNTYSVRDEEAAKLLKQLHQYEPAVIGLDIYRDVPFGVERTELVQAFNLKNKNNEPIVIGVDKFADKIEQKCQGDVASPPELPDEQVGFVNLPLDPDGNTRRTILSHIDECTKDKKLRLSLGIRLAERFLNAEGYELNNDPHDDRAMVFTSKNSNKIVKLPRFTSFPKFGLENEQETNKNHHPKLGHILASYGGYIRSNEGLNQILLSPRRHKNPYQTFSLSAIKNQEVKKEHIQNRIVLIGMTTESHKDFVNSAAIIGRTNGRIFGVEIHAHIISQILSAVIDERPILKAWLSPFEYLWIIAWGLVGIYIGRLNQSPWKIMLYWTALANFALFGICYGGIVIGWWIPLIPSMFTLILSPAALLIYRYDISLKLQIEEREAIIEKVITMIHNPPQQIIKLILRNFHEFSETELLEKLNQLDVDIESVLKSVKQEISTIDIRIMNEDLNERISEIYCNTRSLDLPCFTPNLLLVPDLQDLDTIGLTPNQKWHISEFMREGLTNVGKYAEGATKLEVTCKQEHCKNVIRIVHNGKGIDNHNQDKINIKKGWGTEQAGKLANSLKGKYKLYTDEVSGKTICELTWSIKHPNLWQQINIHWRDKLHKYIKYLIHCVNKVK